MTDFFETPLAVAERLVWQSPGAFDLVIDPGVGGGALLKAAAVRWPDAELVGVDIAPDRAHRLQASMPEATIVNGDFHAAPIGRRLRKLVDRSQRPLFLLNPPFSTRGGRRTMVTTESENITTSPALAFVIRAVDLLGGRGMVSAIIPQGALWSDRDQKAREWLSVHGRLIRHDAIGRRAFRDAVVHTSLVTWVPEPGAVYAPANERQAPRRLIRGVVQMHRAAELGAGRGGVHLVHTTNMREGRVIGNLRAIDASRARTVEMPSVLFPRVGKPSASKVALWPGGTLALSDCVLALECTSVHEAQQIQQAVVHEACSFAEQYAGTGAPYTTVARLERWLAQTALALTQGFQATPVELATTATQLNASAEEVVAA